MASVILMPDVGAVTADQVRALRRFEVELRAAIDVASDAGVPQGYIVALLHGFAHRETAELMQD